MGSQTFQQIRQERISSFITVGMFAAAWVAPGMLGKSFVEGVLLSLMLELMILIGAVTLAAGVMVMKSDSPTGGCLFTSCALAYLLLITYGMTQEFGSFWIPVMAVWLSLRSARPFFRADDGESHNEPLVEITYELSALLLCFMILFQFPQVPRLGFGFELGYTLELSNMSPQNLAAMGMAYFMIIGLFPPPKFVAWMRDVK
ncbi:MAG: hypothetical protein OEZ55_14165 [Nitrospinota bacterium]|nr:hypothetical protein [Nitrospinota bacterium]MDH5757799.1 hypothetical protein [Nitrospinota bacterium]